MCKSCKKQYSKNHYILNKEKYKVRGIKSHLRLKNWYKNIKIFKKCEKCGEDHIACLEFHHINPLEKKFNISMAISWGWSKNKILKEMDKCIVLCSNCHKKEHFKEI